MKNITNYIPILTGILIVAGYGALHNFYTQFNIPIWAYISINEILILCLPVIVTVITTTLWLIHYLGGYIANIKIINKENYLKEKYNIYTKRLFWGSLISLLVLLIISITIDSHIITLTKYSPLIIGITYFVTFFVTYISILRSTDFVYVKKYYIIFLCFGLLPIYLSSLQYQKRVTSDIKLYGSKIHVAFVYKNIVYKYPKITYIGETHDYIFVYNKQKDESLIFPKSDISFYSIKNKK